MALIPWYQIMTTRSQLFITVGKVETRRYYQNVLSNSKYFFFEVVKEIIKHLHAGQIQLVVNKQSG